MKRPILLLLLTAVACTPQKAKDEPPKDGKESVTINADGTKTLRAFYKNKKIKSEVIYRDSSRHGIARSYDEAGNLTLEVNYAENIKDGKATRFYAGGAVFQVTDYLKDEMHGIQLKYRTNGNPLSEARYENDYPCLGLKEFRDDKTLRKKYPQLVIREIDRIEATGDYKLELSMTDNVRKVKYYTGRLTASGCLSDSNNSVLFDEARPTVGIVKYKLFPGEFIMDELNIVAVAETLNGNSYVCQKTFNVAIKN
jgi:hypothetical protein